MDSAFTMNSLRGLPRISFSNYKVKRRSQSSSKSRRKERGERRSLLYQRSNLIVGRFHFLTNSTLPTLTRSPSGESSTLTAASRSSIRHLPLPHRMPSPRSRNPPSPSSPFQKPLLSLPSPRKSITVLVTSSISSCKVLLLSLSNTNSKERNTRCLSKVVNSNVWRLKRELSGS